MSFTIKPDTRVLFRMCWSWKHGSLADLPTNWTEEQQLQWIRAFDEECRIANLRGDERRAAAEAAEAPAAEASFPIPEGLISLGRIALSARPHPERIARKPERPELGQEDFKPTASSRLAGRN
jgi:hypothetical protein